MKQFVLTTFQTITFADGVHVISYCTCNPTWRDKASVFECDTSPCTRAASLAALGHACPHARALQLLWTWQPTLRSMPLHPLTRLSDPDPPPKIQQTQFPGAPHPHLCSVWLVGSPLSGDAAVVYCQGGVHRCTACSASKRCLHVKQLTGADQGAAAERDDTEDAIDELASIIASYVDATTGKLQVRSVSQERIADGITAKLNVFPEYGTLPSVFVPYLQPGAACGCGRLWNEAPLIHASPQRKSIVYSLTWFREVDVFQRMCTCGQKLNCNFRDYGILNLNNLDLFSHELLQWYSVQLATSAVPFFALWRTVVECYADRGLLPEHARASTATGHDHASMAAAAGGGGGGGGGSVRSERGGAAQPGLGRLGPGGGGGGANASGSSPPGDGGAGAGGFWPQQVSSTTTSGRDDDHARMAAAAGGGGGGGGGNVRSERGGATQPGLSRLGPGGGGGGADASGSSPPGDGGPGAGGSWPQQHARASTATGHDHASMAAAAGGGGGGGGGNVRSERGGAAQPGLGRLGPGGGGGGANASGSSPPGDGGAGAGGSWPQQHARASTATGHDHASMAAAAGGGGGGGGGSVRSERGGAAQPGLGRLGPGGSGGGANASGSSPPGGGGAGAGGSWPQQATVIVVIGLLSMMITVFCKVMRRLMGASQDKLPARGAVKASAAARGYGFFINKRAVFQEAWLNFVALQEPNYDAAFRCRCPSDQCMFVIADGILLGVRKEKSHLRKPWGPPVSEPWRPGSLHRQRSLLPRHAAKILQRMCTGDQPTVTSAEYKSLLTEVDKKCMDLKPYIACYAPAGDAGGTDVSEASPQLQSLLLAAASESPVCAYVPGIVHSLIDAILEVSVPTPQSLIQLTASAPLLGPFVSRECNRNGGALPLRAQKLLRLLLSVARKAYQRSDDQVYVAGTTPRSPKDVFSNVDSALEGPAGAPPQGPGAAGLAGTAAPAGAAGAPPRAPGAAGTKRKAAPAGAAGAPPQGPGAAGLAGTAAPAGAAGAPPQGPGAAGLAGTAAPAGAAGAPPQGPGAAGLAGTAAPAGAAGAPPRAPGAAGLAGTAAPAGAAGAPPRGPGAAGLAGTEAPAGAAGAPPRAPGAAGLAGTAAPAGAAGAPPRAPGAAGLAGTEAPAGAAGAPPQGPGAAGLAGTAAPAGAAGAPPRAPGAAGLAGTAAPAGAAGAPTQGPGAAGLAGTAAPAGAAGAPPQGPGAAGLAGTAAPAGAAGAPPRGPGAAGGSNTGSPEQEFMTSGFYYPSRPWLKHLGHYFSDRRTQITGKQRCTKYKYDSKNLSPGLFVMHCLNCGVCLGFHMLENAESPQALFEVLYTRWPQPPKVVVYDNNCHAHAYFLNREPEWVTNTLFVIDKTHFRGHTGCCKAYDIARYSSLVSLNSQLAEQRNAKLAMLKSHCAYMSQPLFLVYVRHFLYMTDKLSKRAENAR
ncbi:hypothetical protein CHLRE_20g751697v5 [Chlamydomonas reinhardtii]|uniref:HMG domain-containing protein n=1 Tax=Chlamydomonas reinhardtii TaxID=3055 RepID=A0A2K3CNC8_CHLRE|nr:uncharacterized protein CHLRE_20g751697v5 [Chlamydomonas reinhardtii]PNW69783.1 hypothetical protein CHLRE_20g751697v5 [Chlamydomonas reinhardtii]